MLKQHFKKTITCEIYISDRILNICELLSCSQLYSVFFAENSHIQENQHFHIELKLKR